MKRANQPRVLKAILSAVIFALYFTANPNSLKAQSAACSTVGNSSTSIACDPNLHSMDEKGPFFLKVYVHAIRKDDGSGGQSQQEIEEALGYLDAAFNRHNIFFVWDCETTMARWYCCMSYMIP